MDNDHDNYVFVEYLSNVNNVVKQTFQSMQRIKLICIDSSTNFLIFGGTSGGVYIFRRDPCEFLKLIPSKEGSANLIAISPDERHLGIATSRGLILIFENFIEDFNGQYQVFSEHEGRHITYIKWHRNELYVGDQCGKVSVISVITALFQTKSIFQIPTASLMTLDSCVVQIDIYQCYLLVSTKTRTYLCNTETEHYIQIGKKLRDGYFGACFCNTSNDVGIININQNTRRAFKTIKENELIVTGENITNTKIYCARPGARLWEVGFDAKVSVTYQFKSSLNDKPSELLVIGSEEESTLQKKCLGENEKITDNFNFQKVFPIYDRFVLTYDSNGIYIFDPVHSKLVFWTLFSSSIKDVTFVNNIFYIWKNNLEINVLSVVDLEHLILATLYKKQYVLCTELCVKFREELLDMLEESKKLYLISVLRKKVYSEELMEKLSPVFDKVEEINEKVLTRQSKSNIVVVENLYLKAEEITIPSTKTIVEDEYRDLKLILKQYKLNKTHRTVDIPEVIQFLQTLNADELFLLFKRFIDYVLKEAEENATSWCQEQYLKQISKRNIVVKDLQDDSFDFLTEALIKANDAVNFSCCCGYPLPKCHKYPPNFYKTALDVLNTKRSVKTFIEKVPYLWRYRVKSEIHGLNVTLLIQFSDLNLVKEHIMELKYDNWHDVLGYFIKINRGLCLNCDNKIDIDGLLTWTELAKVIIQSMGTKNTLKILEKYEKVIPNGALDQTFYQSCIFAHSFTNDNSNIKIKPGAPFKFVEEMDKPVCNQFQETLENYLKRKYIPNRNPSYNLPSDNTGMCYLCNLPLKNDILFEYENVKGCGHRFHKFCFNRNNNVCNLCN